MVIFHSYVNLTEGKNGASIGIPKVEFWYVWMIFMDFW